MEGLLRGVIHSSRWPGLKKAAPLTRVSKSESFFRDVHRKESSMEITPTNGRASERHMALHAAVHSPPRKIEQMTNAQGKLTPVSEYFGSLTFGLGQMREKL